MALVLFVNKEILHIIGHILFEEREFIEGHRSFFQFHIRICEKCLI